MAQDNLNERLLNYSLERVHDGLDAELVFEVKPPADGVTRCPDGKHCCAHTSGPDFPCCRCGASFEPVADEQLIECMNTWAALSVASRFVVHDDNWFSNDTTDELIEQGLMFRDHGAESTTTGVTDKGRRMMAWSRRFTSSREIAAARPMWEVRDASC